MKMQWKAIALVLLVLVMIPAVVSAQKASLDPAADPNYGTWPLADYPDPFILTVDAGGDVNAAEADLGATCAGFVTTNPDIVLEFNGGSLFRAFFASTGDTTLVMALPDGTFLCNDDMVGTNPVIDVNDAPAGNYALWIGTYGGGLQPGHLVVTTGPSLPGALVSDLLGSAGATSTTTPNINTTPNTTTNTGLDPAGLNSGADPAFGVFNLAPNFQPDPTEVDMTAGGEVDVFSMNLGSQCRGYVANVPDARISYGSAGGFLRIFFQSTGDTTMIVRLPNGSFICNDDFSGTLDPLVDIDAPAAGDYEVWVGTFSSGTLVDGTLVVTGGTSLDPSNS